MPSPSTLLLFTTAAAILIFAPGPNTLYIIARSVQQGWRIGVISSLGVQTGTIVHMTAAALGLSALLLSSALAFNTVKCLGAAYLIYLGIKTLRAREGTQSSPLVQNEVKPGAAYRQGVVVNVLNPKCGLFFLAFLPQFLDPARGSVIMQILLFGVIMIVLGICSDSIYAVISGRIGNAFRNNRSFARGQRLFAGWTYITLGGLAALTGRSKSA